MKNVIDVIFNIVDQLFMKVPFMKALSGYKTAIGLTGMAVVAGLRNAGVGDPALLGYVNDGLLIFTGLALNSKGRSGI